MSTTSTTSTTEGLDESAGTSVGTTAGSSSGTTGGTPGSSSEGSASDATGFDPGVTCPDIYEAVCGEDGKTYDNACVAGAAGVEVRREGPCAGDCEGSCVVAPQGPSVVGLVLLVLALVRPRRRA